MLAGNKFQCRESLFLASYIVDCATEVLWALYVI